MAVQFKTLRNFFPTSEITISFSTAKLSLILARRRFSINGLFAWYQKLKENNNQYLYSNGSVAIPFKSLKVMGRKVFIFLTCIFQRQSSFIIFLVYYNMLNTTECQVLGFGTFQCIIYLTRCSMKVKGSSHIIFATPFIIGCS